jgi:hypothetical protein
VSSRRRRGRRRRRSQRDSGPTVDLDDQLEHPLAGGLLDAALVERQPRCDAAASTALDVERGADTTAESRSRDAVEGLVEIRYLLGSARKQTRRV